MQVKIIVKPGQLTAYRKKAITRTVLWLAVMIAFFATSMFTDQKVAVYLKILACIATLGVAQCAVRFSRYLIKRSPQPEILEKLLHLPFAAALYCSVLVFVKDQYIYIDYIVLTSNSVYLLADGIKDETKKELMQLFYAKGIELPVMVLPLLEVDSISKLTDCLKEPLVQDIATIKAMIWRE